MNITELMSRIKNAIDHGANPEAKVLSFDPDSEQWEEVSILVFNSDAVLIYTDEPGWKKRSSKSPAKVQVRSLCWREAGGNLTWRNEGAEVAKCWQRFPAGDFTGEVEA